MHIPRRGPLTLVRLLAVCALAHSLCAPRDVTAFVPNTHLLRTPASSPPTGLQRTKTANARLCSVRRPRPAAAYVVCQEHEQPATPEDLELWQRLPAEMQAGLSCSKVLGRGSFGMVVLADKKSGTDGDDLWADDCDVTGQKLSCDDRSTRRVALKIIRPRAGEEALAMREGLVLTTLAAFEDSSLILRCLDYGVGDGIVFIVLEYLDGLSLDRILAEEGPLDAREVARVGAHVAAALSIVHRAGFVYRDIKPQNIVRTWEGRGGCGAPVYRLVDFGSTCGMDGCLFGRTYNVDTLSEEGEEGEEGGEGEEGEEGEEGGADLIEMLVTSVLTAAGDGDADDEEEQCRVDTYGAETAARLYKVFRSVDLQGAGIIPSRQEALCLDAVGIKTELAQAGRACLPNTSSQTSKNFDADGEGDGMTAGQLVDLFAELVQHQDERIPVGSFAYMAPEQMLQEIEKKFGSL